MTMPPGIIHAQWQTMSVGALVIWGLLIATYGASFGSFLNVCIYRWGTGQSVRAPRSFCPACTRPLPIWENVPVVAWLVLRGRCRGCDGAISLQYPLVETAIAGVWVATAVVLGPTPLALLSALCSTFAVGALATRWRYRVRAVPYRVIGAICMICLHAGLALAWWTAPVALVVLLDLAGYIMLGVWLCPRAQESGAEPPQGR
jgi:prepilin signal peptidase PulO-like enzyme (type II secretory pathway)